jgi:kynurenine 3-monooxygenase
LQKADLDEGTVTFLDKSSGKVVVEQGDLIVGADGTYSAIRRELMRRTRMNYQQYYIEHGYMELCIPPTSGGEYAMDPNSLHIWPRHEFMMIALPNTDCSFTVTLFMPFDKFEAIKTEDQLFEFFRAEFPDSLPLIGEEGLSKLFFGNPVGPLMTVKCTPYNYKGKCVIIGDSSHSMTPFCMFFRFSRSVH